MSKLLKAAIEAHRPRVAARLTKENGYDEKKHVTAHDLHKAGIINDAEKADLDGCVDDLAGQGDSLSKALNAIGNGKLGRDKANDDAFLKALMAMDGATDSDEDEDDGDSVDEDEDADEKVLA